MLLLHLLLVSLMMMMILTRASFSKLLEEKNERFVVMCGSCDEKSLCMC